MNERTFFMIKPDGIQRCLIGDVVQKVERKGYKITAMKMLNISREMADTHYGEHKGKPFFDDLVEFITSGPVVAMVVEGEDAINGVRTLMGETDPKASAPGTIRGDFGIHLSRNVVHGSDSPSSSDREISIFFSEEEIMDLIRIDEQRLYPREK